MPALRAADLDGAAPAATTAATRNASKLLGYAPIDPHAPSR